MQYLGGAGTTAFAKYKLKGLFGQIKTATGEEQQETKQQLQSMLGKVGIGGGSGGGGKKKQKKDDVHLTELLTKLYTLQEDVGARPASSAEEKEAKARDVNAVSLGTTRSAQKAGSKFLELKSAIVARLKIIEQKQTEERDRSSGKTSVAAGNNPRDIIAAQTGIREELRQANREWDELKAAYQAEARKRRSKFTPEELAAQSTLVTKLRAELDRLEANRAAGYGRGAEAATAASLNARALNTGVSPLFNNGSTPATGSTNPWSSHTAPSAGVALTEGQQTQLEMIERRDQEFDEDLDVIGETLDTLNHIAEMQNEEVQRQNKMLDGLGNRVDKVNDHVASVNEKMKETLAQTRGADKICVDIICIVIMLGFGAVIYNIFKFLS